MQGLIASTQYSNMRGYVRLHEVGRFNSLESRQFARFSLVEKRVIDYVVNRQNEDGGYTFCQGTDSNAQDTYYGLSILDLVGAPFPNVEKTVKWLRDFVPDSLYSHYYVAKALKLCGREPNENLKDFLLSLQASEAGLEQLMFMLRLLRSFYLLS
jgi:hypothetical protein